MSVTALQDDFQRLQVSRSIENGPIESELPNESTAPATESLSPLDLFIRDLDERKGKLHRIVKKSETFRTVLKSSLKLFFWEYKKKTSFLQNNPCKQWELL